MIWGGLHGLGLAVHKLWMSIFGKSKKNKSRVRHFLSVFITFHLVTFAWIFFRAQDMDTAFLMINRMFSSFTPELIPQMLESYWIIFTLMLAGFIIHWLPTSFKNKYTGWFIEQPIWVKILIAAVIVIIIYQAKSAEIQPFIYFQF
jgi:D-alanyl-lipoteichoic acid acyltransferase DltB (MBOAT superfamily)